MFGGYGASPTYKNDLWWYDPASGTNGAWIDKTTTAISPTARYGHSMVWDPIGQRVIMFGGRNNTYPYNKNDLWWYDPQNNTWIEQAPVILPSARFGHSMVWDPVGQRVIMFGGVDAFGLRNDLWWYDPASGTNGAWIDKTTAAISPTARIYHSMVWDPIGQRVIMFGGIVSDYFNDLWWYDPIANTWTEKIVQDAVGSPSVRFGHSMVWDPVGMRVIMFGGADEYNYFNDLWWWW
jgi:N-acetylneuraminic acid mutarotase